jgi:uncharacterized protein
MKVVADSIRLSATDLANYLGCRHLTELDRAVATGKLSKPDWFDPSQAILAKRGAQHEAEYVEFLRAKGLSVVALHGKPQDATVEAMKLGFDVIVQATLSDGNWMGNADILLKVKGKVTLAIGHMRSRTQNFPRIPELLQFYNFAFTPTCFPVFNGSFRGKCTS